MPENVGAAIVSKIERIFLRTGEADAADGGSPDRFMAFHVPAMPYDPELLALVNAGGAPTTESSQQQRAFAQLVNMVPQARALYGTDGGLAWESYGRMLDHGRLAHSALSEAEQAELQAADALLYGEDGSLSSTYTAYLELQRHWETADEEVRNLRLGIEASDDPAYREAEEAKLTAAEAARERALQDWVGRGRRFEIEAAIAKKIRLGSRALHDRWDERAQRFEEGMRDDPEFGSFWRTGFAPEGVIDDDTAWSPITIDKSEISGLIAEARGEVREAAQGWSPDDEANQANVEVERITMRALKLDVVRSWFDASLFESRFWRLPAHLPPASDGASPPIGALPAYVTGLVLVKDIDIKLKASSAANDRLVRHVSKGKIGLIGPFAVRSLKSAGTAKAQVSVRALDVGRLVQNGHDGDRRFRAAVQSGRVSNASIQALKVQRARVAQPAAKVVDKRKRNVVAARPIAKAAVRVDDRRAKAQPAVRVRDHRVVAQPAMQVRDHRMKANLVANVRDHRSGTKRIVRRHVTAKPNVVVSRTSRSRKPAVLKPAIVRKPARPVQRIPITRVPRPVRVVPPVRGRLPPPREPSLPPTTRPGTGTTPDKAADNTVFVVAFLCARTPRSPDPDETLAWT